MRTVLRCAYGIEQRGSGAVLAPLLGLAALFFAGEVLNAFFSATAQGASHLQLTCQQRVLACKLVGINAQERHATKQQAHVLGI